MATQATTPAPAVAIEPQTAPASTRSSDDWARGLAGIEAPSTFGTQSIDIINELRVAWQEYQTVEKRGLAFGQRLYELRVKTFAQGNHSGEGFLPKLQQAGIPQRTAYYWIHSFEISIGEREQKEKVEKPVTVQAPKCSWCGGTKGTPAEGEKLCPSCKAAQATAQNARKPKEPTPEPTQTEPLTDPLIEPPKSRVAPVSEPEPVPAATAVAFLPDHEVTLRVHHDGYQKSSGVIVASATWSRTSDKLEQTEINIVYAPKQHGLKVNQKNMKPHYRAAAHLLRERLQGMNLWDTRVQQAFAEEMVVYGPLEREPEKMRVQKEWQAFPKEWQALDAKERAEAKKEAEFD